MIVRRYEKKDLAKKRRFVKNDYLCLCEFTIRTFFLLVRNPGIITNMPDNKPEPAKPKKKLISLLVNKYLIVFLTFAVFVTFFDEHNLIHRWQTARKIDKLEDELKFYQDEIKATRQKKRELQSSNENLEKFAREHYYLKSDDEDIFIIKE